MYSKLELISSTRLGPIMIKTVATEKPQEQSYTYNYGNSQRNKLLTSSNVLENISYHSYFWKNKKYLELKAVLKLWGVFSKNLAYIGGRLYRRLTVTIYFDAQKGRKRTTKLGTT